MKSRRQRRTERQIKPASLSTARGMNHDRPTGDSRQAENLPGATTRDGMRSQCLPPPEDFVGSNPYTRIMVVGVGGGGCNAVDRMIAADIQDVEFVAVNTDMQALRGSRAPVQIEIGTLLTGGLGSGGDPVVGQCAAEENRAALYEQFAGVDMVCLAVGMGGGTGTGAAPIIAALAREQGALTVAVVTRPFSFEGRRRQRVADQGIAQLRTVVDTLIIIPNDRLLQVAARETTFPQAFMIADGVLRQGVQALSDLLVQHGLINVDFGDVRTIMRQAGTAVMSVGIGRGSNRTVEAVKRAIKSPLLETNIDGARGVIFNVSAGEDLGLLEVQEAANIIAQAVDSEANIIFGAVLDRNMPPNQVKVTLIATGFSEQAIQRHMQNSQQQSLPSASEAQPAELPAQAAHSGDNRLLSLYLSREARS